MTQGTISTSACEQCGSTMSRGRSTKRYCSPRCRKAASRAVVSVTVSVTEERPLPPPLLSVTSASAPPLHAPDAPVAPSYGFGKIGDPPLQGDDYPLEFYDDGYPKLPDCLRRKSATDTQLKANAA